MKTYSFLLSSPEHARDLARALNADYESGLKASSHGSELLITVPPVASFLIELSVLIATVGRRLAAWFADARPSLRNRPAS